MSNKALSVLGLSAFASLGIMASLAGASAPPVVLGGTSTMQDMLTAANTDAFRAAGGGLYLHHNGWVTTLTNATERKAVWNLFKSNGQANIEFGFGNPPTAWVNTYNANYLSNGVNAETISVNALSAAPGESGATLTTAKAYIDAFKNLGVKNVSIIFSPNFDGTTAAAHPFGDTYWDNQRTLATYGGAWTSDTPPSYFFARDQAYRDWIVAQTQWTNANNLKSINIISPHTSGTNLFADSVKYVRYFEEHDAIPQQWVVENYAYIGDAPASANYVNQIGSEDNVNNLAYTAKWLINHVQGRAQTLDLSSDRTDFAGVRKITGSGQFSTAPADQNVPLQNTTSGGARVWKLNLANLSTNAVTDFYAATLAATPTGDVSHWSFTFTFKGIDITDDVLNGGYTLTGADLLEAGETAAFSVSILRLAGAGAPFDLNVFSKASPDATVLTDSLSFSWVPEPAMLGLFGCGGMLALRRRRIA